MNPRIKFLMTLLHGRFENGDHHDVIKFLLNGERGELTDAHIVSLGFRFKRGINLLIDGKTWSPVNPSLKYSIVKQDDSKTRWLFHGPLDSVLIANAYYLFCEFKNEFKQCKGCKTFFFPVDNAQKYHSRECCTKDLEDEIRKIEYKKILLEHSRIEALIWRKNYVLVWSLLPENLRHFDDDFITPNMRRCRAAARHRGDKFPRCKQPVAPGEVLCVWHGGRHPKDARRRMRKRATALSRWTYRRGVREHRVWHEEGLRLAHELQRRMIDRLQERAND